jgi:hypothetical protein
MISIQSKEFIQERLSYLNPIKYNRFQWWRNYDCKSELTKYHPLIQRIQNGDFDFSHYYWQAQNAILQLNEAIENKNDFEEVQSKSGLYMEKYRRLIEDFEKDEKKKLQEFKKASRQVFKVTPEEYDELFENFFGTLEEFYYFMESKYK